jgi:hypothetical protein
MLRDFTDDVPYPAWRAGIQRTHRREIHARVLDLNHKRLAWIQPHHIDDGQVTIDVTRETTRVLNLTLLDPSRSFGWEPDSPSSLPKHLRRMVQVFDVRFIDGYDPVSCPLGVFPVTEMDREGAEVSIVGVSKEHLAMGSFGRAHSWKKGRKIVEVIGEILVLAGETPGRIHLPNLPGTLQKDFNVSRTDQPLAKARNLARQLDCVLFPNGRGHIIVRRKPLHPSMAIDKYMLTSGVRIDRPPLEFFNRWVALGKKPSGNKPRPSADVWLPAQNDFSGVALGRDVGSTRVPRWYIQELDRPQVETKAKLQQIVERARDEKIRGQAEISLDCLPFPNVEEWDLLKAVDPFAGTALVQVRQATIPLVGESQTIGAVDRKSRGKRHGGFHPATSGGLQ